MSKKKYNIKCLAITGVHGQLIKRYKADKKTLTVVDESDLGADKIKPMLANGSIEVAVKISTSGIGDGPPGEPDKPTPK